MLDDGIVYALDAIEDEEERETAIHEALNQGVIDYSEAWRLREFD
jgi:hypothetical protein